MYICTYVFTTFFKKFWNFLKNLEKSNRRAFYHMVLFAMSLIGVHKDIHLHTVIVSVPIKLRMCNWSKCMIIFTDNYQPKKIDFPNSEFHSEAACHARFNTLFVDSSSKLMFFFIIFNWKNHYCQNQRQG